VTIWKTKHVYSSIKQKFIQLLHTPSIVGSIAFLSVTVMHCLDFPLGPLTIRSAVNKTALSYQSLSGIALVEDCFSLNWPVILDESIIFLFVYTNSTVLDYDFSLDMFLIYCSNFLELHNPISAKFQYEPYSNQGKNGSIRLIKPNDLWDLRN
jgi:hypothetical protein